MKFSGFRMKAGSKKDTFKCSNRAVKAAPSQNRCPEKAKPPVLPWLPQAGDQPSSLLIATTSKEDYPPLIKEGSITKAVPFTVSKLSHSLLN